MGVLNDYRCKAHGLFEAYAPVCPYGCSKRFVSIEFNQAPSLGSARTKNTDRNIRQLAADYGMTDVRNDPKAGTSVMQEMSKRNEYAPQWGQVPHAPAGFSQRNDAAKFDPGSMGVSGDGQVRPGMFRQPRPLLRKDPRGMSDLT